MVRILAFRPMECEHGLGPTFVLSDNDKAHLGAQLEEVRHDPALRGMAGGRLVPFPHPQRDFLIRARPGDLAGVFSRAVAGGAGAAAGGNETHARRFFLPRCQWRNPQRGELSRIRSGRVAGHERRAGRIEAGERAPGDAAGVRSRARNPRQKSRSVPRSSRRLVLCPREFPPRRPEARGRNPAPPRRGDGTSARRGRGRACAATTADAASG